MTQKLGSTPLSHNVTVRRPPPTPLTCDVIYGCPLRNVLMYSDFFKKSSVNSSIKFRFYLVFRWLCCRSDLPYCVGRVVISIIERYIIWDPSRHTSSPVLRQTVVRCKKIAFVSLLSDLTYPSESYYMLCVVYYIQQNCGFTLWPYFI